MVWRWIRLVRRCTEVRWRRSKALLFPLSLRRPVALVVALSLWMGTGCLSSSEGIKEDTGDVFGEIHWYV